MVIPNNIALKNATARNPLHNRYPNRNTQKMTTKRVSIASFITGSFICFLLNNIGFKMFDIKPQGYDIR